MIKRVVYLIVIVGLLAGAGVLVFIAPYHIYTLTLTEGVNTRFLQMSQTKAVLYDGDVVNVKVPDDMVDEALYQPFHFGHFEIPMPLNHSTFFMIPTIRIEAIGPRLGASFQSEKNAELFSFMMERPYKLETTLGDQKLFILPVFKNYISRKSTDDVWADLFKKRLSLPSNEGKSFFESLKILRKVSYYDLVYNLYLLYNRRFVVPENTLKFSFYEERKIGIVELPSDDPKVLVERLYILEKGFIYPMMIKTRLTSPPAKNFRAKFIREITYKETTVDSAIAIYARYKQIPYTQRLDQQGMTYLYSAWSHDLNNRDFIRVIILFLEKGKLNLKYLKPFYDFAYKKFGSSLSSESGYLNESAEESLKRKIGEDLEKEVKKATEDQKAKFEGQFANPEEKIKYNLQKAKDTKINSDDKDKMLMIE